MDYRKTGLEVLEAVGGKDNVAMLTHCATRLRFEFRDKGKVDRCLLYTSYISGNLRRGQDF